MSRCFPFPPPGYEKKARTDDADLLKKEKHREKKHKKEKKDKEKREDKDRKEKDKSNGKHRDKKDRKEKSKEKKKDKEREKDRDKTNSSQEKKSSAQVESCNGDHKLNHNERERVKDQHITSNEKKRSTPFAGHIREKPVEKFDERAMDKFELDLCGRIKDEEKGSASQSMEGSLFIGCTNHDRMVKNKNGIIPVEMEKENDRRVDDIRKMDGQGVRIGATISASRPSTLVQNILGKDKIENKGVNISGGFQNRAEKITRILEKSNEPRDKNHKKEREDKRESKRKDKDKEKKSHGKDKEREKEKKKEEKSKEKNEQKIKELDEVKDRVNNGYVVSQNIKFPPPVPDGDRSFVLGPITKLPQLIPIGDKNLKISQNIKLPPFVPDGDRIPAVEGNLKKRNNIEGSEFLHETNAVLNKKLRPTLHPSIENGRKLEPGQAPVLRTPDRKVSPLNNLIEADNNEHKVNGKIEVQPLSISLEKPSSSSSRAQADQIAQAPPVKPPHPDTKYLSEILSVPKIDEWSDFDDANWLFSSKDQVSLSAASTTEALETPRIWDKAMQIESADVYALPYVIPY